MVCGQVYLRVGKELLAGAELAKLADIEAASL